MNPPDEKPTASQVRGQPSLFAAVTAPFPVPLLSDVMTADTWSDADIPCDPTYSVGSWLRTTSGKVAYRKPGVLREGGSSEAFREFLAYHIAGWLHLPVPRIELYFDPEVGPCCLSMAAGRGIILKPNNFKLLPEVRETAAKALQRYTGILALDVLMGAMDRHNPGNHLYAPADDQWWSIDYACCFNLYRQLRGVGDPAQPYEAEYFQAFLTAISLNPQPILDTLKAVGAITNDAIEGLVSLPPDTFASPEEKAAVRDFLIRRRDLATPHAMAWLRSKGLGTIL